MAPRAVSGRSKKRSAGRATLVRNMTDIVYYVAASLDGFIAGPEGQLDWLDPFQSPDDDHGYADFYASVDAVILGRATYEFCASLAEWPYPDRPAWVLTRAKLASAPGITFTGADPREIAAMLARDGHRRAWLVGGGQAAAAFRAHGLIAELIVTILPVLLGRGIPMFAPGDGAETLARVAHRGHANGAVQVHCRRASGPLPAPAAGTNALGQPVGAPLPEWRPPPPPPREAMTGRWCTLEPLDPDRHAAQLWAANALDAAGRSWTYLASGPFARFEDYRDWVARAARGDDPVFFAVVARDSGEAVGVASYLRIAPAAGSIEVGHLHFSPRLQRTPAATEAMYLMMRRAFELGYRRYEWKCDALNAPSRAAARRLGFAFEGIFRKALVYRGRSRDTAWYAVTEDDWPALRAALERWLAPENFDAAGRQRKRLSSLTAGIAAAVG